MMWHEEEHFENEHTEEEGRKSGAPHTANIVLDINQSGSRNFRSSSVVYRTQFKVSTVKCAKEILAVVIKV